MTSTQQIRHRPSASARLLAAFANSPKRGSAHISNDALHNTTAAASSRLAVASSKVS